MALLVPSRLMEEGNGEKKWIPLRGGPSDRKEYVYTTLNGLGILMISSLNLKQSPNAELLSAAALVVQTGSFNDPDEIQGLSHYLEHMIFMGSEKYPGENEYDAFITSHGGSCNAFTENEYTLYSFEIPQQYFFHALDIFANCFISPLLSPSSSEREILAIENEFQLAVNSDDVRIDDLLCQLADPTHFLHKFSWGNLESLKNVPISRGIDINSAMRDYFQKYYFPENSQLVVMAPFPIQMLHDGIVSSFSNWQGCPSVLVKHTTLLSLNPFPKQPYLLRSVPIEKRSHTLKIVWTIPSTLADYQSKSHEYLSTLIGHEGEGSILSALKHLNLAHGLVAGVGSSGLDSNSYFSLFSTTVELTSTGVLLWTQVVKIIFQYIAFLCTNELEERIFQEIRRLSQIQYDFEDEIQAEDLITELAVSMTAEYRRSPFHLLESRYLTPIWDPNSIRGILDNLNPRNCHVILLSSLFPEVGSESESGTDVTDDSDYETDDSYDSSSDESSESFLSPEEESNLISTLPEEHRGISTPPTVTSSTSEPDAVFHSIHFNMPYWKDTINEELIVYWEDKSVAVPGSETLLQLPPPNKYIPRDLQVRKLSKQGPEAVFSSPNVRVWHASDPRFQIPKGIVTFSLLSNYLLQITSHESEVSPSPMIAVFHDLIPRILNEYLLKELYLAEMAYLESEILPRMNGIVITVNGFHDKILSLSSMIFRSLFDDQLFSDFRSIEIQVENLKKEYQNDSLLSGDAANTKRLEMLLPHQVPKPIRLSSLNQLYRSRTSFINSLKKYLQGYLESCCCEIFVYGNISVQDSVSFGKAVNKKLSGSKKGSKGKILHRNSFQQPSPVFVSSIDALTSIKVTPKSESERNVCLQVYFQVGSINPRDHSLLELLQRMMEEPLFNELRTQKQLGYDVSCYTCNTYSMLGYTLEIVSSSHRIDQIREDLFTFLNISFLNFLKSLSIDQYTTYQNGVISRLETPLTLVEAAAENWLEIEERRYLFHAKKDRLCLLPTLSLTDVVNFYEKYFLDSPDRKILIIESSSSV